MDLVNLATVLPPNMVVPPPNPGITPAQLYQLSDHEAISYPPELLVEAALSVWTSSVYDHFHVGCRSVLAPHPVTGAPTFKHFEFTFTCRFDPEHCRMRTRKRKAAGSYGTKNLKEAVSRCNRRRGVSDNPAPAPVPFTNTRFRAYLLIWCAASRQPFNVLRDPIFRELLEFVHPGISIPSPQTVSRDLTCAYNQLSLHAREKFQEINTAIHLAIDGWTSPLAASFLGIVAIWYEGATMWRSVLEFIHLTESHTGEYLAERTLECLTRFRIVNQIMTMCLDNAGNNGTFVRSIGPSLPNFLGPESRTNCLAHTNNLTARSFMSPCNRPTAPKRRRVAATGRVTAPRTDTNNQHPGPSAPVQSEESSSASNDPEPVMDEIDRAQPAPPEVDEAKELHDSGVVQDSVLAAMNSMRLKGVTMTTEEAQEARDLFPKASCIALLINAFVAHLHRSPTDYAAFSEIRKRHQDSIHSKVEIPSAVNVTRWDSEMRCAETYRALRTPIEVMLSDVKHRNLHKFRLTPKQWDILDMMYECLQVFREVTLFAQQTTPTIHEVLPVLSTLRYRLLLMRDDVDDPLHPALRIGAEAALTTLDKYKAIMAVSHIYRIATALCPWYKLQWFAQNGYSRDELLEIVRLIQNRVDRLSTGSTTSTNANAPHAPAPAVPPTSRWMRAPAHSSATTASNVPTASSVATYFNSPLVSKGDVDRMGGILKFWVRERETGSPLARVALDILTAPASSADAERAFSAGRMAVNYRQHRMSLSTFRAKMALGSWYGTPLLPDIDEVEHVLNDWEGSEPEPVDL